MATEMGVPFLGRVPLVPEVVALADQGRPSTGPDAPPLVRASFTAVVDALAAQLGVEPVPRAH